MKVALVTGVSSGIGHATATALARAGFRVFGTSRKPPEQTQISGVEMLQLDVTNDASVAAAVSDVMSRTGRIDVLVNNAGIGLGAGAEESTAAQAQTLFDTNVFGTMRMTRAVLPHMRKQRSGRIVNISSVLGFIPAPYMALYASTKHAIEGYSESLDHEVRNLGIRVALIEPAYTATTFEQNMLGADATLPEYDSARQHLQALTKEVMVRADKPEVIGQVVVTAATTTSPKLRYPAGALAKKLSLLRRFVPAAMFDASMRKEMKLEG